MARFALADPRSGVVANVIVYDPASALTPPDGLALVALPKDSTCQPGDSIDSNGAVTAKAVVAASTRELARARLEELRAKTWPNLTAAERVEVAQRLLEAL